MRSRPFTKQILPRRTSTQVRLPKRRLVAERLEDRSLLAVLFEHGSSAPVRVLVPTQADYDDLGFDWTGLAEPFDDSAWVEVSGTPNGVGYDRGSGTYDPAIGLDVEASMYEDSTTLFARAEFNVENATAVGTLTLRLRYDDGFIAWLNGVEVARANVNGAYPLWNARAVAEYEAPSTPVAFDISEYVTHLSDGPNVLAIRLLNDSPTGDDALLQFTLTGETREGPPLAVDDVAETLEGQAVTINVLANDREGSDPIDPTTVAIATLPQHGTVLVNANGTITYTPSGIFNGPDSFTYTIRDNTGTGQPMTQTLVATNAPVKSHVPSSNTLGTTWRGTPANEPFNDSGWQTGTLGVGYDTTTSPVDFNPYIGRNVQAMQGVNTTVYMRSTFSVMDPASVSELTLRIRYDDGFAAFINGVQVASNNAPSGLTYNSSAPSGTRPDSSAVAVETFNLSPFISALRSGTNVLAIQGLNQELGSSDLLVQPELTAVVNPQGRISNAATVSIEVSAVEYPPVARDDQYQVDEGNTLVVNAQHGDLTPGPGQVLWPISEGGNGHLYQIISADGFISWFDADAAARARGGHLASLASAAENDFVFQLTNNDAYWHSQSLGPWIGGYQPSGSAEPAGGWRWVTEEPFVYSNWATGEPNNAGSANAIHYWTPTAGVRSSVWNDQPAVNSVNPIAYVVEWDSPNTSKTQLLISDGADWNYHDLGIPPTVDPQGDFWKERDYDDAAWSSGPAELGYGDGDESTVINCGPNAPACSSNNFITTWFRRRFTVDENDVDLVESLLVELLRDDGAAVYLNGVEIVRDGLPGTLGDATINANVPATGLSSETTFYTHVLDLSEARYAGLIRAGENVIAVEVHQSAANSSDVSFDLRLWATTRHVAGLLANDSDQDNQPLAAVISVPPANGTLDLGADGTFEYTPNPGFIGIDTFTYRASDGVLLSEPATVTITVRHLSPAAQEDVYEIDEDATLSVTAAAGVLINDSDSLNHSLTAVLATPPSNGIVTLNPDGSFVYTPVANFSGPDSFTYRASDGMVQSSPTTVLVSVRPINDVPIGVPDTYLISQGSSLVIGAGGVIKNISTGFHEATGLKLANGVTDVDYVIGVGGTGGSHGGALQAYRNNVISSYLPDNASANSAWIILPTIDRPPGSYFFDTIVNVPQGNVGSVRIANFRHAVDNVLTSITVNQTRVYDVDNGNFGAFTSLGNVGQGAFQPGPNLIRFAVFNAGSSASAMAFRAEGIVEFDPAAPVGLLTNDSDVDNASALTTILANPTSHGTVALNENGTFTYTPEINFTGVDEFTYRVSDGLSLSASTTVRIVVSPPGKPPEDLNADGTINAGDVAFLMASYGEASGAKSIEGDLDGDGRISVRDAIRLRNAFTPAPSPSAAAAIVARASGRVIIEDNGASVLRAGRRMRRPNDNGSEAMPAAIDRALTAIVETPSSLTGRRSRSSERLRG